MIPPSVRLTIAVTVCVAGCGAPEPEATGDSVVFAIDMTGPVEAGWFDPASEIVGVRGDASPLSWGETLPARDDDGDLVYEAAVRFDEAPEVPVAFKFKVDGVDNPNDGWQDGANRAVDVADVAVYRRSFGDPPDPRERTFTGTVEVHEDVAHAELALAPRDLYVYLPPGYADSDRRFPVLYMHDGQNVFDASEVGAEWRMDEASEELVAAGEIEPMIIVGIGNTGDRTREYTPTVSAQTVTFIRDAASVTGADDGTLAGTYRTDGDFSIEVVVNADSVFIRPSDREDFLPAQPTEGGGFAVFDTGFTLYFERTPQGAVTGATARQRPQGGGAAEYGRLVVEYVKPYIDERYRTLPDRANTALGGSSFGGLATLYLGLDYRDVFGQLLVVSPSVWWDNQYLLRRVGDVDAPTGQRIWLDMGGREGDRMVDDARLLHELLRSKGWTDGDLQFVEDAEADHSERAWAERTPDMLRFLDGGW